MTEGTIPFIYQGETFQTYYKPAHRPPRRTWPHPRLPLPISDLAATASIPVIFYDQLGNGRSTHLREKPPTFWTIDLFIDELVNLLSHLSISDSFSLLGHSWGGILGSEFEVRKQPAGLKRLVLTNSLAASSLWNMSNGQLLQSLPQEVQEGMAVGMRDPQLFYAALQQFHAVYGCTVVPIPKEMVHTFDQVFGKNGDPTVASAPILNNWTIVDRLHLVRVPTFVINGRKDIAQDFVVVPFFEKIQKVNHTPFLEEREKYNGLLEEFLNP
ncbi:proline iminopeptidase [Amylocystis lapponica]|nr:proline iminopeptidase [Amylocystis lapponica]